jgi:hypothetical protein
LIQHQQQQYHNTKAGASSTSTLGWKSSARSWHLNNINTKLEIFSTRLASTTTSTRSWKSSARGWHQQHQHEAGNLQHEAGINNINTKLEIFSTRLASTTSCGTLVYSDPKDLPRNQKIP